MLAEPEPAGMESFVVPPELQQILVAAFSGEKTNQT